MLHTTAKRLICSFLDGGNRLCENTVTSAIPGDISSASYHFENLLGPGIWFACLVIRRHPLRRKGQEHSLSMIVFLEVKEKSFIPVVSRKTTLIPVDVVNASPMIEKLLPKQVNPGEEYDTDLAKLPCSKSFSSSSSARGPSHVSILSSERPRSSP
jgi:hypothetical protein